MKILFASEYFVPFAPGGAEWSVFHWVRALAKLGHRIVVVTPDLASSGTLVYEEDERLTKAGDVTIVRFPFRRSLETPSRAFSPYVFGNPFFSEMLSGRIARAAVEHGVDLIAAQGLDSIAASLKAARTVRLPVTATIRDYRPLCPMAICLHRRTHAPAACTLGDFVGCLGQYHQDYGVEFGPAKRLRIYARRMIEWHNVLRVRTALVRLDGAVFVSQAVRDVYERAGLLPSVSEVVYNLPPEKNGAGDPGPARERFGLSDKPFLLFVGRFSLGKGAQVVAEAIGSIREQAPGTEILVAGNVEYNGTLGPGVRFLGHVDQEMLEALYAACRAVMLPSRWPEPFSRVLLEAAAASVPVVATRAGGNEEAVAHGVNGLLVERDDPKAFAVACVEMLRMPEERYQAMRRQMGRLIENRFSPERLTGRLTAFYERVATGES